MQIFKNSLPFFGRVYERLIASYLSSIYLEKRKDATKQISLTVIAESEKVLNLIFKSPAVMTKLFLLSECEVLLESVYFIQALFCLCSVSTGVMCAFPSLCPLAR